MPYLFRTYQCTDSGNDERSEEIQLQGNETVDIIKDKIYEKEGNYITERYGGDSTFVLTIKCNGDVIFDENETPDEISTFSISDYKDSELVFIYLVEQDSYDDEI